jgi:predicted nucleic acid-binding protein
MILDSDILIDVLRGHKAAVDWLAGQNHKLTISGIAAIEVAYGSTNSSGLQTARRLIDLFAVEWPTAVDMQAAFAFAALHLSDGIDSPDAITAAVALRLGVPVATFNSKHFQAFPGLTVVQPYER